MVTIVCQIIPQIVPEKFEKKQVSLWKTQDRKIDTSYKSCWIGYITVVEDSPMQVWRIYLDVLHQ